MSIALLSNAGIAAAKYVVGLTSGSPAMLAEAYHSTADLGVEILLLWGMKRSERPPDSLHPFGYGKTLYFYSFLVAVYIFGVGGTLAIYQGVSTFRHAGHPGPATWSYVVLGIAAAFDFSSWLVSYRELLKRKDPGESTWDEIVGSKDPSVFTVFLEDSAGLIGVFIAFVGILLGQVFHNQRFDAAASILIGVLLAGVAVLLGRESGALLIGERTNRTKIRRVRAIISADPWVEEVCEILTMQLGPEQVLLAVYARFQQELGVQELESTVSRLEQRILQEEPTIKRVFIEAKSSCSAAKPHP